MKQSKSLVKFIRFWEGIACLFMALFFGTLVAIKMSFGHLFNGIGDILSFGALIIFPGFLLFIFPNLLLIFIINKKFDKHHIYREIEKIKNEEENQAIEDYLTNLDNKKS